MELSRVLKQSRKIAEEIMKTTDVISKVGARRRNLVRILLKIHLLRRKYNEIIACFGKEERAILTEQATKRYFDYLKKHNLQP